MMKSNSATPFCKVCFQPFSPPSLKTILDRDPCLCAKCFREMGPVNLCYTIEGIKTISLYRYNEKIKGMLFDLKGCGDYEMAKVFLVNQKPYLKHRFRDYYLVPAPSFEPKNIERGFNHVEEIFTGIGKGYIHAIMKIDGIKQADLNYRQRQQIGAHLTWNPKANVVGKKILFVDDLITTGATAKACCHLLMKHGAKEVRILSVAKTPLRQNHRK